MKTKSQKKYFSGGAISSVVGLATNAAQQLLSVSSYEADATQDPYKVNWGNVVSSGGIGLISELLKKKKDERQRAQMVLSATPGAYANGGPVYSPTITNPPVSNVTPTVLPTQQLSVLKALAGQLQVPIVKKDGVSGHSKSKSTFRERAYGGTLDQQLSSSAALVQGNPQQTDGNYYPNLNAKLDHGEVVKNRFVYSNQLTDPKTNQSFASLARLSEIAAGKAEKRLKTTPYDSISQNTIEFANKANQSLATTQEGVATRLGLRGNTNSYATGGSMDPGDPEYPYMLVEQQKMGLYTGTYYDPYKDRFLKRDRMGEYSVISDAGPGLRNKLSREAIEQHKRKYPLAGSSSQTTDNLIDPIADLKNQLETGLRAPSVANNQGNIIPQRTNSARPTAKKGIMQPENQQSSPQEGITDPYFDLLINQNTDKYNVSPLEPLDMLKRKVNTSVGIGEKSVSVESQNMPEIKGVPTSNIGSMSRNRNQKFTIGDALQGVEVLSKFGQLAGGPEREKAQYDNTSITKRIFDPTQALYQSQRSFDSSLSNLEVGSINARRAFANRMLATKLNADSQVATQYGQMNAGALTEYEGRISNQRRYNNAQTQTTNEINAQNRAAYKEAIDTAFNSLGNFGQALNAKKQGYDQIQILKSIYPEVYKRILNSYGG